MCVLLYIYIYMLDSRLGAHIKHLPQASSTPNGINKVFFQQNGAPVVTVRGPPSAGEGPTAQRRRWIKFMASEPARLLAPSRLTN